MFPCSKKKNTFLFLFCLISSTLILLFCTKSSPLYPFNDWEDANIIFTVGRGMLDGKVPYRDLFDQKGPVSFFLYAIAALISRSSFIGLYLLEVAAFSGFLFFSCRTIGLYQPKNAYLTVPVLGMLVASAMSFSHGGSIEELFLPACSFSLFEILRSLREQKPISRSRLFLHGVLAGCMFWAKYTMTGFYIAWIAVLFAFGLAHRNISCAAKTVAWFLLGMAGAAVPWLVYFTANNALGDLFRYYFFNNIAGYGSGGSGGIPAMLFSVLKNTGATFFRNPGYSLLIILGVLYLLIKKDLKVSTFEKIAIAALCVFSSAGIYIGGTAYRYYGVLLTVFACLGFVPVLNYLNRGTAAFLRSFSIPAVLIETVLCVALCPLLSDNAYLLSFKKKDLPQYQFAEVIRSNASDSSGLLCYHMLDSGFYMVSGIEPENRCFTWLNSATKEISRSQKQLLESGNVDFIVTRNRTPDFSGFSIVDEASYFYEGSEQTYHLYQRNSR